MRVTEGSAWARGAELQHCAVSFHEHGDANEDCAANCAAIFFSLSKPSSKKAGKMEGREAENGTSNAEQVSQHSMGSPNLTPLKPRFDPLFSILESNRANSVCPYALCIARSTQSRCFLTRSSAASHPAVHCARATSSACRVQSHLPTSSGALHHHWRDCQQSRRKEKKP